LFCNVRIANPHPARVLELQVALPGRDVEEPMHHANPHCAMSGVALKFGIWGWDASERREPRHLRQVLTYNACAH
jgi:hypothetical protein